MFSTKHKERNSFIPYPGALQTASPAELLEKNVVVCKNSGGSNMVEIMGNVVGVGGYL